MRELLATLDSNGSLSGEDICTTPLWKDACNYLNWKTDRTDVKATDERLNRCENKQRDGQCLVAMDCVVTDGWFSLSSKVSRQHRCKTHCIHFDIFCLALFKRTSKAIDKNCTRRSNKTFWCFAFKHGSPNFLTTVRGPDILSNVIVSGYTTFHQINELFVNVWICHYRQTGFAVGRKWLRGPDLASGPSLESPAWEVEVAIIKVGYLVGIWMQPHDVNWGIKQLKRDDAERLRNNKVSLQRVDFLRWKELNLSEKN